MVVVWEGRGVRWIVWWTDVLRLYCDFRLEVGITDIKGEADAHRQYLEVRWFSQAYILVFVACFAAPNVAAPT